MKLSRTILIAGAAALLASAIVAHSTVTNYLGTVAIMDGTTATQQLAVNSDGTINTAAAVSSLAGTGIAPGVGGSAASSAVLKASAGNLYGVYASCTNACWLMVFNATSAPSNGATTAGIASGNLQDCIPIPAGSTGSINYNPGPPEVFATGITATISSTSCATLTLSTVGFIHGSAK